jgi:hypothetical protein
MLYSVDFAHILYFCNASCGSAENMVMTTMISRRWRRGYLRTVTFESVYKRFADFSEVKKKTLEVLNNISTEEFQKCFQQW